MYDGAPRVPQAPIELGEVVGVNDPEGLNRVQVRFLSRGPASDDASNSDGRDATPWALVATGFAGDNNGAFLLPDVGSRVILSCLNGDPAHPVVLGAVWDGSMQSPDALGGSGEEVDRWAFTGKAGTRVALIEESGGSKVEIKSANGNKIEVQDGPGRIKLTQGGNTITLDSGGIKLRGGTVEINATTFRLTASTANFTVPMATYSAAISCQLLQTTSVVSTIYTPGLGNML